MAGSFTLRIEPMGLCLTVPADEPLLTAARTAHGTKVVVIDPRRTATAEAADLHLPIAAGSDVALFNGLLSFLSKSGKVDRAWADRHVAGQQEALAAAGSRARPATAVARAATRATARRSSMRQAGR